jgi:biofilm protein TabA
MKNVRLSIMVLMVLMPLSGSKIDSDPEKWSSEKLNKWFASKEWSEGWSITPDSSINKKEFAVAYFRNRDRWAKAFKFLSSTDLLKLENKRYDIDGDKLFASVSEYPTKDAAVTDFESHKKYIDIQYVISGKENMNLAPLSAVTSVVTPYDASKDIGFMKVSAFTNHLATPGVFFIFFPGDAHRPGIKDGLSSTVKKVVIKLSVE